MACALSAGDGLEQGRELNTNAEGLCDRLKMGCILDPAKPPDDGYEEAPPDTDPLGSSSQAATKANDDYASDFEDDDSEGGRASPPTPHLSLGKVSKSHSSLSTHRVASRLDSRTKSYGSLPVPQTRRINMSFSNDRLRDIERANRVLLNKILSARGSRGPAGATGARPPPAPAPAPALTAPAALHRKHMQKRIDHDNMILLRKIQGAKSSSLSFRN